VSSKIQRELALLITGKDVSASRSLRNVNRELGKLENAAGKAGSNISRNIQRGIVVGAGVAVGAIGFAINAAQDWESAFAGVAKTVDGDVTAIGAGIREMATEIPVAATELAGIAEAAGALGVAKEDILGFTHTVALLGETTDLSSGTAATALGHLKTTIGLTGSEFETFGNTLVALGNNGASTESQILGMAENIAGASKIIGLSKDQVLGWSSALANTGEEIEAGGSSLQRFFLETAKAVAGGGKDLATFAKAAGMSAKQFKKAFGKDASGALQGLLVHMGKLTKAEQLATLEALGFTDIRIQRALLKLLGNTDNLTDSLNDSAAAWDDNNAMTKEAEKRFATTAAKVQLLKNNFKEAAIIVGSELLPVIQELAAEGVDWLKGHQKEIAQFAKDLAAGIRDAVKWAKTLDWNAIANALKTGAGFAAGLVEAFANAPPWLQQFLAVGFVANKFTGGALQDVFSALASGLIKGILGINAGVVNINAGIVNGAGVIPGVAGAAGSAATGAGAVGAAGVGTALVVGAVLVGGTALSINTIATMAEENNKLAKQGLTANEIAAQRFYNANQADQSRIQKQLGYLPTRADFESGSAKLAGASQASVRSSERLEAIAEQERARQAAADSALLGSTQTLDATTRSQLAGVIAQVAASGGATTTAADEVKRVLAERVSTAIAATVSTGATEAAAIRMAADAQKAEIAKAKAATDLATQATREGLAGVRATVAAQDLSVDITNNISTTVSIRDQNKKWSSQTKYGKLVV
jgi:TP901 family phage tail tape measure protein